MSAIFSTGFKRRFMQGESFASIFENGVINLYTGPRPSRADDGATGTLIGQVTNHGLPWNAGLPHNGLRFYVDTAGIVRILYPQDWRMTVVAGGEPVWWRLYGNATDTFGASFSLPRLDGDIGLTADNDAEMQFENFDWIVGAKRKISNFYYTIPPVS